MTFQIKNKKVKEKKFSYEEHIRKHTKKENTYNSECLYCNPQNRTEEMEERLKRIGHY